MNAIKIFGIIAAMSLTFDEAKAWGGYDYETGGFVEIDEGNLVRPGSEIEVYDYTYGEYKNVEVQSINGSGSGAEV